MDSSKVPVRITFHKPGTQPPIFVGGTFADPPWSLHEMDYTTDDAGNHTFKKEVFVEPGSKVQFKFRIGTGDWWVLDEDAPTVTDEQGNRNNVIEAPMLTEEKSSEAATALGAESEKATDSARGDKPEPAQLSQPERGEYERQKTMVANAAKAMLGRSQSRSGASTPAFARTAAEVADSAALLDQDESDSDISDGEAGRLGVRRLSYTPIPQVADTAAEVADAAEQLDAEPNIQLATRPDAYDNIDPLSQDKELSNVDNDHGDHKAPLFSHECIGMYEEDGGEDELITENDSDQLDTSQGFQDHPDADNPDFNDPTLEAFPLSRHEIIDTVRKLETGLSEDHVAFEGVPLSPVVGPSRRGSTDPIGDSFTMESPTGISPVRSRNGKGLEVPKEPYASVGLDRMSVSSLQSISEGDEPGTVGEDQSVPIIRMPIAAQKVDSATKSPTSDEDDSIVVRQHPGLTTTSAPISNGHQGTNGKTVVSSELAASHTPQQLTSGLPDHVPAINEQNDTAGSKTDARQTGKENSGPEREDTGEHPLTVVQPVEQSKGATTGSRSLTENTDTGAARSTGMEYGTTEQMKRRKGPTERTGSPTSIRSTLMDGNMNDSWFAAAFRILFVSWLGGWISTLSGGKQKMLLAATTAAVVVSGLVWWKMAGKDGW